MAWLGIYPRNLNETINKFFNSCVAYWTVFILICAIPFGLGYIFENWSIHVKQSLSAFKMIVAVMQAIGMFLSIGVKMREIKKFHFKFQDIVDRCEFNGQQTGIFVVE